MCDQPQPEDLKEMDLVLFFCWAGHFQVIMESKTKVQIPRDTIFVPLKGVSIIAARPNYILVYSDRTNCVMIAVL
jgi:hypothetical protein